MANYLVTGCAGFIGARVSSLLLADGHDVTGVDDLNHSYDVRLKDWRLGNLQGEPHFRFHQGSIGEAGNLEGLFSDGFDAIVNLAARAGVPASMACPEPYFETNVKGTLSLLELCRKFGVPKFVLASTSSLYGSDGPQPFKEDQNTDRPLSPYAASKKAAEVLCYTYHQLYGIDVSILRYFTVYGPAGRPDMSLFRFVQWIAEDRPVLINGDGSQSRDFTYVDDIAQGTIAALRPLGYEIINLGSNSPVRLNETIGIIETLLERKAVKEYRERHPTDVPATWAHIGKAASLLGWRPQVTIAEGLRELVDWYQENREWAKDLATTNPGAKEVCLNETR